MIIGIDDTDSKKGMCTTYLAAVLLERLKKYGEIGIPRLIRLNPCIKYKTRGNGAAVIEIKTDRAEEVEEIVIGTVEELAELKEENTNPGVVFVDSVPDELTMFSDRAIKTILGIEDARKVISKFGFRCREFKNGRGLIGALAAAGASLPDYTYELTTYRYKERWGSPRQIDAHSVWLADRETYPLTWDTVDVANGKIVFAPHSPCPVLYGIRGDSVDAIFHAHELIQSEPVERHVLFKTNQGTDSHLICATISEVEDGRSYILNGRIERKPFTIAGGHVIFTITDGGGGIDCAAYEPTKGFRDIIRKLTENDEVAVYGSVKNGTMNVEKIEIKSIAEKVVYKNPVCPVCRRGMESAGKDQGYRCRRCKTYSSHKNIALTRRDIKSSLYEVPPVARRHISKPLVREKGKKIHPSR